MALLERQSERPILYTQLGFQKNEQRYLLLAADRGSFLIHARTHTHTHHILAAVGWQKVEQFNKSGTEGLHYDLTRREIERWAEVVCQKKLIKGKMGV